MAIDKVIQIRRGLETNRSGETPAAGELLVTTDTTHEGHRAYMGDGSTGGGILLNHAMQAHPGMRVGFYYTNHSVDAVANTGTASANFAIYQPIYLGGDETTSATVSFHINVVAGSGGATARWGLYSNSQGKPLTRLADSGAVSVSSSGWKTFASALTIQPGWYWTGFVTSSASPTFTRCSNALGNSHNLASNATAVAFVNAYVDVSATLPATATATFPAASQMPIVWVKR